uniref:Riok2 protein n=1 Tax=Fopius arisanus TaxID=64838 RepID=A0A0C9RC64_9HYME
MYEIFPANSTRKQVELPLISFFFVLCLYYLIFFSREDCVDVEIKASGLTRQMEKDLLIEMGIEEGEETPEELLNAVDSPEDQNIEILPDNFDEQQDLPSDEHICSVELPDTTSIETHQQREEDDVVPELINLSMAVNSSDLEYDSRSVRSTSTTATIPPEVIKARAKLALQKRNKKAQSRKILAKGEASATTRIRRDNRDNIQQSTGGFWGGD